MKHGFGHDCISLALMNLRLFFVSLPMQNLNINLCLPNEVGIDFW